MEVFFLVVPLLSVSGNVFLVFCSACYSRFFSKAGHRTKKKTLGWSFLDSTCSCHLKDFLQLESPEATESVRAVAIGSNKNKHPGRHLYLLRVLSMAFYRKVAYASATKCSVQAFHFRSTYPENADFNTSDRYMFEEISYGLRADYAEQNQVPCGP